MTNLNFSHPPPLSLYVHYPWCIQKCPYCDFNSHNVKDSDNEKAYVDAMLTQLEQTLPLIWGRPIRSIFFGGGTPSLFSEKEFSRFMSHARALLGFSGEIEVTLEANPGTVDYEKFSMFFNNGVNRLSMGIQSFDNEKLKALGRIHSSAEAKRAIEAAKSAGFKNFNLDLMFALPIQTLEQAIADVEQALEFEPPHLSHYQLTLEPNTPFYRQPPVLPDDDLAWEMQLACQNVIAKAGYEHYEVSAYAKSNQRCLHNLNYWQFGDYLGIGAGAHGKITHAPNGEILRTQMPASPGGYIEAMNSQKEGRLTTIDSNDLPFEFMLNTLRLQEGFALSLFEERTGLAIEKIQPTLRELESQQLIECQDGYLELTEKGKTFLNDVMSAFLTPTV